jgi:hypothetical protein
MKMVVEEVENAMGREGIGRKERRKKRPLLMQME